MNYFLNRRQAISQTACGLGSLALSSTLLNNASANPLDSQITHHLPKAKRVIFLFMHGGPSHVDTFDYKPTLQKSDKKDFSFTGYRFRDRKSSQQKKLMASPWEFKQHGQSGKYVSSLFPHQAKVVDDLCFMHGMHTEGVAHGPSTLFMHTGSTNLVRPSVGSWVNYGLGTENKNLPGFVTLHPPLFMGGQRNYGSAFLPSHHQGSAIGHAGLRVEDATIKFLNDEIRDENTQNKHFSLLNKLNKLQVKNTTQNKELETAIKSFELAAAMQKEAPELLDVSKEPEHIKELYGMNNKMTKQYGQMCLMARRLSEAGVRYIQVNYSDNRNTPRFDQHGGIVKDHPVHCKAVDQPVAALIQDLKQRGLLEDTLVVWTGEFGRTPFSQGSGRDHNPFGFTSWMAGGGVKAGFSYGSTDEVGYRAAEGRVHTRDMHATILHLLGLNHERLTYRYAGRDFRLTDTEGHVVKEIIA
ncbi:MAG: DUF1501 domain-containing protein [Lentisphaeraceae bacterium]|nr:DUF1501 domain-containing protein [Lentisphaeraceae bacterium]